MSPRTYKASEQTKTNVLQKAVELFNEHGTAGISMNSLAETLGMSAGNLQYHYRNKEELLRALLELMFKEFDAIYPSSASTFTLDTLRNLMRLNFELSWKYRFFFRELGALLRNDESLAIRFREIQEKRLQDQENIFKALMTSTQKKSSLSAEELRNVVLIGWVLGNTWLSYMESMGQKINETALQQAVEVMVQHYKPYLKEIL